MEITVEKNEKIAKMTFASIYPQYVNKIKKKGRSKDELHKVIKWLTGFNEEELQKLIKDNVTFEIFFQKAKINPKSDLIKGSICGCRIEEIDDKFIVYKQCRYLDKLVDELAKGWEMRKILREENK